MSTYIMYVLYLAICVFFWGGGKVGIVGATGAVGEEIVGCLAKRGFLVSELKLFASARSAGKVKTTPLGDVTIEEFTLDAVSAFFFYYDMSFEF